MDKNVSENFLFLNWHGGTAQADDVVGAAHLFNVPVHVPLSHRVVPPCLHHFVYIQVDADQAVIGDTQRLIFTTPFKPVEQNQEERKKVLLYVRVTLAASFCF